MSCNLPLLFSPIEFENDFYIDGGIIDNYLYLILAIMILMLLGLGHYQLKNMI